MGTVDDSVGAATVATGTTVERADDVAEKICEADRNGFLENKM